MKLTQTLAVALEAVGCAVVLTGVSIELITHADFGFVIITSGAWLVATGGMIWAKLVRRV